ncbi:MTH1187 family thiamine-binding protein [Fundidesulfovibrio butyratiphilus]
MSVVAQLAVFPLDKGGAGLSAYVARVVELIRESGLPFALGPMGTSLEGDFEAVMAVVSRCFAALSRDCDRVYMTLALDYRAGRSGGLASKTASVDAVLEGRK